MILELLLTSLRLGHIKMFGQRALVSMSVFGVFFRLLIIDNLIVLKLYT